MILKEFRELRRDRRTVAMLVFFPMILLVIFGYAANFTVSSLRTDVVGPQASAVAAALPAPFRVTHTDPAAGRRQAYDMLRSGDADVAIVTGSGTPAALVDGSSLFTAQKATAVLSRLGDRVRVEVLFNPGLKTSWVMVPALVGLILTFIGTVITSIGLVRERQTGTLEQLAVMPLRPSDIIIGKIAPYFMLAALDMTVVTVLGCLLFGVPFTGSVPLFALGAAIYLLVVLGLGVLISTVSQNQGQAIQAANFILMPQILLSGLIFPLAAMAAGVRWIGYVLPLTYFIKISRGVMLRDAPLSSLWPSLLVLAGMAVLVLSAAILRFRRDLAPPQPAASAPRPEPVGAALP